MGDLRTEIDELRSRAEVAQREGNLAEASTCSMAIPAKQAELEEHSVPKGLERIMNNRRGHRRRYR